MCDLAVPRPFWGQSSMYCRGLARRGPPCWLHSWFDTSVKPLLCSSLTLLYSGWSHRFLSFLTSHFVLKSTWNAVEKGAGLSLFMEQYNKSGEFNMGSVLQASSGSQSQSPPGGNINQPLDSDWWIYSQFRLFRQRSQAWIYWVLWQNFWEMHKTQIFPCLTSVKSVRHCQQKTISELLNETCNKMRESTPYVPISMYYKSHLYSEAKWAFFTSRIF